MTHRLGSALWGTPRRAVVTVAATTAILLVAWVYLPIASLIALLAFPIGLLANEFRSESKQVLGRALGWFSWASHTVEREGIRVDVEGTLVRRAKELNRECPDAVPHDVQLKFIRDRETVDRLENGTIVLGIAHHTDRSRNLVAAAWAFSRHAILPDARPHLDPDVSVGIDLVITKDIVAREDPRAIKHFFDELWGPAIKDATRLRRLTAMLDDIQTERFLSAVALPEFVELGRTMGTRLSSPEAAEESAQFVEYLHAVATHEPDQHVPQDFQGANLSTVALYVAEPEVALVNARPPVLSQVDRAVRRGFRCVYLLARGRQVDYLEGVVQHVRADARFKDVQLQYSEVFVSGLARRQLIVRARVDWRPLTSIGRRPYLAAGQEEVAQVRARFLSGSA